MRTLKYNFVLLLIFIPFVAVAQPGMMEKRPFERVERLKKVRLIEILDLKEEQSVRFFARFNDYENKKKELQKQKDEVLDKLERLVRNRAEDKEFEKLFPEVFAAQQRIGEEHHRFFNSVGDILTTEQRAKLLLFERHFDRELREAMRELQRRRGRSDEQ